LRFKASIFATLLLFALASTANAEDARYHLDLDYDPDAAFRAVDFNDDYFEEKEEEKSKTNKRLNGLGGFVEVGARHISPETLI
jgi:hypothetical protein